MPVRHGDLVTGFVWCQPSGVRQPLSSVWRDFFARQTLPEVPASEEHAYRVLSAGLPDAGPGHLTRTLLEEMAWALVARPPCDVLIYPLYVSVAPDRPPILRPCTAEGVDLILSTGFLAMCRPRAVDAFARWVRGAQGAGGPTTDPGVSPEVRSRALLEERAALLPGMVEPRPGLRASSVRQLKALLGPRRWTWLKRQYFRMRAFLEPSSRERRHRSAEDVPLAHRTSWQPPFPHPDVKVRVPPVGERIPVWIALHWLELGGAEKFAVDLIKALPKDRYAVYVTTDVPSENSWANAIRDEVEEVLHLPEFLPDSLVGVFCQHYVRTRRLRLLHINHAPRVYESLFHIRRFHQSLKVLHTLHILELPPYSGGYPEWAMTHFSVLIDHHHVISDQLKRFLMERWLVAEQRIDVVRINVDPKWFDPAAVPRGMVRRWFDIPDAAILIGFIGRFARQKRPLEFVRLAKLLSDQWKLEAREPALRFIMAGDGTLRRAVQKAVRLAGLEDVVHLMGETTETRPVYADCDVIAMPSENEGLALVTYEAMAMATPVFFTDVGAQSELLEPEQLADDAMPVAPALADRLWPYLVDAEKRRALGERQRARIVRHHSMEESMERMVRLYERLLENTAGDAARQAMTSPDEFGAATSTHAGSMAAAASTGAR